MGAQNNPFVLDDYASLSPPASNEQADIAERAGEASDLLKAMAHEGRLMILSLLAERERSVTELETILALRQPAVSQQLARLRADNLVSTRREGKLIYYSLVSNQARELVKTLSKLYPSG